MNRVLAALDTGGSAREVLDAARRVGRLTDTGVVAVHVRRDPADPVDGFESMADGAGVALRILDGDPGPALVDALLGPEVIAAVIGGCAQPRRADPGAWRVARSILEQTDTPVVVVPSGTGPVGEIHRLLLPLEGSEASSRCVLERLVPLVSPEVDLEVLHVFTADTVPAMLDQPTYDLDTLGREFLGRHFPGATTIEFRGGGIVEQVARVSVDRHIDLIVLSWSRCLSPRHARVIRGVLEGSSLPVLLLPVLPPLGPSADAADVRGTTAPVTA